MKYDPEKSFGYPVLRPENDDYVKSLFQFQLSFDIDHENPKSFLLDFDFSCGVREMKDLITVGNAAYWIKISCRSTFYSRMIEVKKSDRITIDGALLRDAVDFSGYIIAKKETNFTSVKINPEFGYTSFSIHNGQILALSPPRTYVTEKEFWKPISSIFEYRQAEDLKDGEFSVDIEDENFVQIFANSSQLTNFKKFEKSTAGRTVLLNTVFFAALCKMVDALSEKPDEYAGKKWAKILEARAASKRIDLKQPKPLLAAQKLLDRPLVKLAESFLEK